MSETRFNIKDIKMKAIKIMSVLPSVIYALLIFYLSNQSRPLNIPELFEGADKFMHYIAYIMMGILIQIAFLGNKPDIKKSHTHIRTLIIGLAYAASDEFHQSFIPGRDSSIGDFIADSFGIITSFVFLTYIRNFIKSIYAKSVQT